MVVLLLTVVLSSWGAPEAPRWAVDPKLYWLEAMSDRHADSPSIGRVAIFAEQSDQHAAEYLAAYLTDAGYSSAVGLVQYFPTADSLAHCFAVARARYNLMVVLIAPTSRNTLWVMLELLTQRSIGYAAGERVLPFALLLHGVQPLGTMLRDTDSYIVAPTVEEGARSIVARLARSTTE